MRASHSWFPHLPAASCVCNVTIALACDAVEAKAKYPLPGIRPTSTSKQSHSFIRYRS
jgi:hypothetical protein